MNHPSPQTGVPGKGHDVRGMFASIAPRYDFLNRVLSLGFDRRWRTQLVKSLPSLATDDRVLDVCTGTGDVALELARHGPQGLRVHASDFCEEMVVRAPAKANTEGQRPIYAVADAQRLPYGDGLFRALTVAFGLRNVEAPERALSEMARVLQPGGRLLILEFGRPQNRVFAGLYRFYFFRILPMLGRLLSGSTVDAYSYLPQSVWAFHDADRLKSALQAAGLSVREQRPLMMGAVMLHVAERADG